MINFLFVGFFIVGNSVSETKRGKIKGLSFVWSLEVEFWNEFLGVYYLCKLEEI